MLLIAFVFYAVKDQSSLFTGYRLDEVELNHDPAINTMEGRVRILHVEQNVCKIALNYEHEAV